MNSNWNNRSNNSNFVHQQQSNALPLLLKGMNSYQPISTPPFSIFAKQSNQKNAIINIEQENCMLPTHTHTQTNTLFIVTRFYL
jgi:hypothetical protein